MRIFHRWCSRHKASDTSHPPLSPAVECRRTHPCAAARTPPHHLVDRHPRARCARRSIAAPCGRWSRPTSSPLCPPPMTRSGDRPARASVACAKKVTEYQAKAAWREAACQSPAAKAAAAATAAGTAAYHRDGHNGVSASDGSRGSGSRRRAAARTSSPPNPRRRHRPRVVAAAPASSPPPLRRRRRPRVVAAPAVPATAPLLAPPSGQELRQTETPGWWRRSAWCTQERCTLLVWRSGTLFHASISRLQPPSLMPSTQETICGREGLPSSVATLPQPQKRACAAFRRGWQAVSASRGWGSLTRLRRARRCPSADSKTFADIRKRFEKKYSATRHRMGRFGLARAFASYQLGVSKRSTFGLAYHFRSRLLGSECVPPALGFQRSEWTGFLAVSVRVKRMYAWERDHNLIAALLDKRIWTVNLWVNHPSSTVLFDG